MIHGVPVCIKLIFKPALTSLQHVVATQVFRKTVMRQNQPGDDAGERWKRTKRAVRIAGVILAQSSQKFSVVIRRQLTEFCQPLFIMLLTDKRLKQAYRNPFMR